MTKQLNILDYIARKEEEALAASSTVSSTRAVKCPGCGEWVFDERKHKVCGKCGRRFRS